MHIKSTSAYLGWKLWRIPMGLCERCSEPGRQTDALLTTVSFCSTPWHLLLYLQTSAWNWPSFLLGREIWTNLSNRSVLDSSRWPEFTTETEFPTSCLLGPLLSSQEQMQGSWGPGAWERRAPSFVAVARCLVRMSRVSLCCQPT